jgi:hypothetical protein
MIWESDHWKMPLLRLASKLARWSIPREWTERELVSIEKDIFIAFYSIRKLMDAKKLSDATELMPLNVAIYPTKHKDVTFHNWDNIDSLYDLTASQTSQRDLRYICNQIIHSYVFVPDISEDGAFAGILFCSDRERNKKLYGVETNELISALCVVGKDYPAVGKYIFNPKQRDYDVFNR